MTDGLDPTRLHRLDIQGLDSVSEDHLAEVGSWLRMAFGLCATLAILGTALASLPVLSTLAGIAFLAALFPVHPFDLIYNLGIRHLRGTRPLPRRGAPTRFACGMGAAWILVVIWAFSAGWTTAGYLLGGVLCLSAVMVATTDICVPSMIFRAFFGPPEPREPRRSSHRKGHRIRSMNGAV